VSTDPEEHPMETTRLLHVVPDDVGAPLDDVVLLDDGGSPIGHAPRATVHGTLDGSGTPLHLAFSCYLLRPDGRVLLSRRALVKRSWPGVWTNSFCGHPRVDEPMVDAIARYARHELGVAVHDIQALLPEFRYWAADPSGVVENEVCPVYLARTSETPCPRPDEVMDLRWVTTGDLFTTAAVAPWAVSPWMVEQVRALRAGHIELSGPHDPTAEETRS
jgi:isopentenyl-diphosphate delta-isomerase